MPFRMDVIRCLERESDGIVPLDTSGRLGLGEERNSFANLLEMG